MTVFSHYIQIKTHYSKCTHFVCKTISLYWRSQVWCMFVFTLYTCVWCVCFGDKLTAVSCLLLRSWFCWADRPFLVPDVTESVERVQQKISGLEWHQESFWLNKQISDQLAGFCGLCWFISLSVTGITSRSL